MKYAKFHENWLNGLRGVHFILTLFFKKGGNEWGQVLEIQDFILNHRKKELLIYPIRYQARIKTNCFKFGGHVSVLVF